MLFRSGMNGELGRDGLDENYSANYGVEGPTADPDIEALRVRQMKNFLATLLLSRGVPMILGGDEFARSQWGNNNAYCQDNEISWYDWRLAERNAGLIRFAQRLIRLRRSYPVLRAEHFYTAGEIRWLGTFGEPLAWDGPANRLGCIIRDGPTALALLLNATPRPCAFELTEPGVPATAVRASRLLIDTARSSPEDAPDEPSAPVMDLSRVRVLPHSLIVLEIARA